MRHTTAGGGGYGDPFERDPETVLADVCDGKVSVEAARRDYGVCVLAAPWRIDHAVTEKLRSRRTGPASRTAA